MHGQCISRIAARTILPTAKTVPGGKKQEEKKDRTNCNNNNSNRNSQKLVQ